MIEIDRWFPTLIYKTILDSDNSKMIEKSYELVEKNSENKSGWMCNTKSTNGYESLFTYSEFKQLHYKCFSHVVNFSEQFLVKPESILLDYSWVNVTPPGDYQEYHNHPNSHFSAVFYLKVPENSGNIVFKSCESVYNTFKIENAGLNENTFETCNYEPKENLLLIFKSNLLHMVTKNLSNEDRISVAMNFRCNS